MRTQLIEKEDKRIVWLDFVKFIAIFMMIAVHCTDNVTPAERSEPWYNLWGSFYGSFMRPAIPLFVMVTGALLLPVKENISAFYKKRLTRLIVPFIIWSVLYNLFPWITGLLGLSPTVINDFFAWAEPDQSFSGALHNILMIPFNFSMLAVQMWYVYLLIGLYLYMPIFSAWVRQASLKEQKVFLTLWFVSLFIPYLREYLTKDLWGTCSWNEFGLLYYFAGFNGYMLLGHYIQQYVNWSWAKTLSVSLPLLFAGFLITYSGYTYIMELPDKTPEQVELFWTYNTPNVAMMTIASFLLVYRIRISQDSRVASWLASLTTCGFGIYMIHYYFVCLGYDMGEWFHIPAPLRIPFSALIILACSWIIVFFAKKVLGKRSVYLLG